MSQPDRPSDPSFEPSSESPSAATTDSLRTGDAPPGTTSDRAEHDPGRSDGDPTAAASARSTAAIPDVEALDARLAAVERALADGEDPPDGFADAITVAGDVDEHSAAIDDLRERVDELAAATDALRGYVGEIRSVNEEVEGRASTAIERVDRLESRLDSLDVDGHSPQAGNGAAPDCRAGGERSTESPVGRPEPSAGDGPETERPRTTSASGRAQPGPSPGGDERDRSADGAVDPRAGGDWTDEPLADAFANGVVPDHAGRERRRNTDRESTVGHRLYERVRSWLRSE